MEAFGPNVAGAGSSDASWTASVFVPSTGGFEAAAGDLLSREHVMGSPRGLP